MARSNCIIAAAYACRKTNSDLPGDVFRRDLQDLRCLRPRTSRDRLSGSRRLASSRGRSGRAQCSGSRMLGVPGPSHHGRSRRRRGNSSLTPSPSRSAGLGVEASKNIPNYVLIHPARLLPGGFLHFDRSYLLVRLGTPWPLPLYRARGCRRALDRWFTSRWTSDEDQQLSDGLERC